MTPTPSQIRASVAAKVRWRTPPEIAAELKVKAATVRGWIVRGELRAIKARFGGKDWEARFCSLLTGEIQR